MEDKILLILTGEDDDEAQEAAFQEASKTGDRLIVFQLLTSELYHYGRHDLIATWPTKRDFLSHIRGEVSRKGRLVREELKSKAEKLNISVEIYAVESEDPISAILARIKEGDCKMIFIKKEKRSVFPILKRTIAERLAKELRVPVRHGLDKGGCK